MALYNATGTFRGRFDEGRADELMDALDEFHPAIGASPTGLWDAVITFPAESLPQAIATARAVLGGVLDLVALEVMPTELWDRRNDLEPLPALASVSEASERLGISRQAVLQRLEVGSLIGRKVGKTWVVLASQLAAPVE